MAKNKTIYNSLTRAAGEVKEGREINIIKIFPLPSAHRNVRARPGEEST